MQRLSRTMLLGNTTVEGCSSHNRTMLLKVEAGSTVPLHEQIAAQLRRAIGLGEVDVGERLPPARQLAESLDVNMHTVLRAYSSLRDEGLLEMRRGRGVSVTKSGADGLVRNLARDLATEAKRHGLSRAETLKILEEYL